MASISGMLTISISEPKSSSSYRRLGSGGEMSVVECSSRPQKKATAHHMKTRPKKTQPWDIKRGPTLYPPLPTLPPDWSLVSPQDQQQTQEEEEEEDASSISPTPSPSI